MHNMLHDKNQSQSIFNQSEITESKLQQSHQCEYYNAVKKANKIINRKNREIQTLNRIIKNLKTDITELNNSKQRSQTQLRTMKEQLEGAKKLLSQFEMREIQNKRQVCQERLENAMKIARNPGKSRVVKDVSRDYFSECQISRNTADQRYFQPEPDNRHNRLDQMFKETNHKTSSGAFNMGQLFMGRKMKIAADNKINKHSSWAQIQLLNKPKRPMPPTAYQKQYSFQGHPPYGSNINIDDAITFIKKQSLGLKSPIF